MPPTFILSKLSEMDRFKAYQKKYTKNTFIAKPTAGCQGDAIMLFKTLSDLPSGNDIIVQKYMDKPLLLDGIKFDLRVYVVVVSLDPIQAFVCEEGLARFCTKKYEAPKKSNYKDSFKHLTNYSINKTSEQYQKPSEATNGEEEEILQDNSATKRTLSSLYDALEKQEIDTDLIKENIADTCSRTM